MKNLFCPKINENDVKTRGKTQKSTFLAQKQMSVPKTRLETMVLMGMDIPALAVRRQLASGIDLMIHLGRLRDKRRVLLEISEIDGCPDGEILLNPIYSFQETGMDKTGKVTGVWIRTGNLHHKEKLQMAGLEDD